MKQLLAKYFSGETSQEESAQVQEWRNATENNAQTFLEYKKIWLMSGSKIEADQEVLSSILDAGEEKIKIIPLWQQKSFRFAATIVLLLGVIFTVINYAQNDDDNPYGTKVAEVTIFELPDGSEVTLQRGAMLSLGDYDNSREVILEGKAFFDVKRDTKNPFYVMTEGAMVEVLGTSFLVNTYDNGQSTEVMVTTGKVALTQNSGTNGKKPLSIHLNKGEMGIVATGERGIKKRAILNSNYLAWKTLEINFRGTGLSEVASTIEDVYGLEVKLENPELSGCRLTANYSGKSVEEVLDLISNTFGFEYERSANAVVIKGSGCQ